MLYCIYIEDGFRPGYAYLGYDRQFVQSLVNSYLKGQGEIRINGIKYGIGSEVFQIYQTPMFSQAEVQGAVNREKTLHYYGNFDQEILDNLFENVTAEFLNGKNWADLKEGWYNLYLNANGRKTYKTVLEKNTIISFLEEWHLGKEKGWLESEVELLNATNLQIYDINSEYCLENKGETKKYINKQVRLLYNNKWTTEVFEHFGK